MKDTDNNINVGDVFTLKAKVLSRGGYCPVSGYVYRLQLLTNNGENLVRVDSYIPYPDILLAKDPADAASAFLPLKIGDIARCVEGRGRKPGRASIDGEMVTVITSEVDRKDGTVTVAKHRDGISVNVDPRHLELLFSVEKVKPYYVSHNMDENVFEVRHTAYGKPVTRMCYFYSKVTHKDEGSICRADLTEDEARKSAEDECNRLNEEWGRRHQHHNK